MTDHNGAEILASEPPPQPPQELLDLLALDPAHMAAHDALEALEKNLKSAANIHLSQRTVKPMEEQLLAMAVEHLKDCHLAKDAEELGTDQVTAITEQLDQLSIEELGNMHSAVHTTDQQKIVYGYMKDRATQFIVTFKVDVLPKQEDFSVTTLEDLPDDPMLWQILFQQGMAEILEIQEVA